MGRRKKVNHAAERLTERLGHLEEWQKWDDAQWLEYHGHDAQWREDAWVGLARLAKSREAAGLELNRADREALRRFGDKAGLYMT